MRSAKNKYDLTIGAMQDREGASFGRFNELFFIIKALETNQAV